MTFIYVLTVSLAAKTQNAFLMRETEALITKQDMSSVCGHSTSEVMPETTDTHGWGSTPRTPTLSSFLHRPQTSEPHLVLLDSLLREED